MRPFGHWMGGKRWTCAVCNKACAPEVMLSGRVRWWLHLDGSYNGPRHNAVPIELALIVEAMALCAAADMAETVVRVAMPWRTELPDFVEAR